LIKELENVSSLVLNQELL